MFRCQRLNKKNKGRNTVQVNVHDLDSFIFKMNVLFSQIIFFKDQ